MPIGEWLKKPLRGMAEECLLSPRAEQRGLFNSKTIRRLWSDHVSGKQDYSHQLWMLLIFELWQREYLDGHVSH